MAIGRECVSSSTKATLTAPQLLCSDKSQPFSTLPYDLIVEIFCRLSVKLLIQLRCVCKSWNSLISDTKFTKKHLRVSTTCGLHFLGRGFDSTYILKYFQLDSIFSTMPTNVTELEFRINTCTNPPSYIVGSCDGIICVAHFWDDCSVLMWNPFIRKFKKLPAFQQVSSRVDMKHGFGYDHVSDNYKVVIVLQYYVDDLHGRVSLVDKIEVKVHSFGTDFWKNVQEFPFGCVPIEYSGKFVSGTINWLVDHLDKKNQYFIVSFDLSNESYQKILLPDYGEVDIYKLSLSVLRDCLCMTFDDDVWIMKEYGHTESWIKLFTFSYMQDPNDSYIFTKPIYMFEDDQMLLVTNGDTHKKLIVYDPRNNTYKFTNFNVKTIFDLEVCIESLISP